MLDTGNSTNSQLLVFGGIIIHQAGEDLKVQAPHFTNERPREDNIQAQSHAASEEEEGV